MSSVEDVLVNDTDGNFDQLQNDYIDLFNVANDSMDSFTIATFNQSLAEVNATDIDPFYFYEVSFYIFFRW